MKIIYKRQDSYTTPSYVVKEIIDYLKPRSVILCPFDTEESEFVKVFRQAGHKVIHSHISERERERERERVSPMLIFLIIQKMI